MSSLLSPPPVLDATRREFLALLGAAGLLTGCGAPAQDAAPTGAAFPRTVAHDRGTVELPAPPQRIYCGNPSVALDCLLALDVVPVLVRGLRLFPWQERFVGLADAVEREPDIEQVAGLRVDLAMLEDYQFTDEMGRRLAQLCPTVPVPVAYTPDVLLDLWGRLLGREERAAELQAALTGQLAAWTPPRPVRSFTLFDLDDEGGVYVRTEPAGFAAFPDRAGITLTRRPGGIDGLLPVSAENVALLDDDALVGFENGTPGRSAAFERLEAAPLFRAIPAVRDSRYVRLTADEIAATLLTPLSVDAGLAALDRAFGGTP